MSENCLWELCERRALGLLLFVLVFGHEEGVINSVISLGSSYGRACMCVGVFGSVCLCLSISSLALRMTVYPNGMSAQ